MNASPTIVLLGASLLLLVAIVVFVAVLVRTLRRRPPEHAHQPAEWAHATDGAERPVDASLEGFELDVSEDAPSAALLTPLRTGEWMPPEQPAPASELPSISLSERIAEHTPAPAIPEPRFAADAYQEWEVASENLDNGGAARLKGIVEAPWAPNVPEVHLAAPEPRVAEPVERTLDASPADVDDGFAAEIAALLPVFGPSPTPEPQLNAAVEPAVEPELELTLAPVLEPELEPAPTPELRPAPRPVPAQEPTLAPVTTPVPTPVPEPAPALASVVVALPEQAPEPTHSLEPERELAARPIVRVAPVPAPTPEPALPVVAPRAPRPRVLVHVTAIEAQEVGHAEPTLRAPAATPPESARDDAPDLVMAAPVEMWFGESRVGVKAGTTTYDRFRKYADILLADLNDTVGTGR